MGKSTILFVDLDIPVQLVEIVISIANSSTIPYKSQEEV